MMFKDRYARQRQYSPIGSAGQSRIESADVTIVGVGALGTVAADTMARAGVRSLRLIDRDVVQPTNLQRQMLFDEADAKDEVAKADAASGHLLRVRGDMSIDAIVADLTADNIAAILVDTDIVIDATDNFATRFLINDWSLETQTPWVHGGAVGGGGQVKLFDGHGRPCFRCLVPELPPPAAIQTCDTAGVIAPATHVVASIQCAEALKFLSGNRDAVSKEVISIDLWSSKFRTIGGLADVAPNCPACVQGRRDFIGDRAGGRVGQTVCGRDSVQLPPRGPVDLSALGRSLESIGETRENRFFVRTQVDAEHRMTVFNDGRVIIDGTDDPAIARTIADRYLGG